MQETPNKYLVPLSIVVAGVMVSGAIYFGGGSTSGPATAVKSAEQAKVEVVPVDGEDHVLGDRNAPIMIVEYSDTECPFCKVFHNNMHEIVDSYEGKVAWTYRHFPIPQLHDKAVREAEATECAAELGGNSAFWSYIDEVFERTNSNDSLPDTELPKIAGDVGLSITAFNECLSSGRHSEAVQASMKEAVEAGARGTPYSVILAKNGKQAVINGAEPLASVRTKIDSLLK